MVSQNLTIIDDREHGEGSRSILGILVCLEFDYFGFQFISVFCRIGYIVRELGRMRALVCADDCQALAIYIDFLLNIHIINLSKPMKSISFEGKRTEK